MKLLDYEKSKVKQHSFKAGWRNVSSLLFIFERFLCMTEMDGLFPF